MPVVLQAASLTGAWGVDYVVMLVPAAAAALLTPGVARVRVATIAVLAVAATLTFGVNRLSAAPDDQRYALVLVGGNAKSQWGIDVASPEGREKIARYGEELSRVRADIAVLPEGAFAATDATLPALVDPLAAVAAEKHMDIVVGVVVNEHHNSALTIPASGRPVEYHKWHDRGPKIQAGHELKYVPGKSVGLVVCGDVNFANPIRDYAAAGTELLAIPASDEDVNGWQHSRTALLRGVENGVE